MVSLRRLSNFFDSLKRAAYRCALFDAFLGDNQKNRSLLGHSGSHVRRRPSLRSVPDRKSTRLNSSHD